jgi:uncharacterized membrane protein YeaQ/YmgE (transglycosylase-associated protein family)
VTTSRIARWQTPFAAIDYAAPHHASVLQLLHNPTVACRDFRKREASVDLTAIIVWLVVGAVAGWLAGQIVKGHGFGLVGNIVVGIVGAFIAGWLLPTLGLGIPGILGSIIYAAIGAVILLFVIGLFKRAA